MGGKKRGKIIRLLKTEYKIGDMVPTSAIYECSECEKITAFRKAEVFLPCEEDHSDEQHWYRTNQFVHFVSRNLNDEFEKIETRSLRFADWIAEVAGNIWFVYLHVIWYALWIWANTGGSVFGFSNFDPYPYGFLTMVVSLEAIFLSLFILISQNRSAQKSELRAELDYQTNLKTEKDVAEILSILNELREEDKLIEQETSEVLEDANILLETPKPKKHGTHHHKKVREIIKEAGIRKMDK
jgi:uncharacterized membrane protein